MNTQLPLKVEQLYKVFKRFTFFWQRKEPVFTAVDKISFELKPGEILGLLGPNGAGKTTTIQMLLGTMFPSSGHITYFGKELSAHRSKIMQEVSFASTYIKLPGRLTIYENLNFYGKLYGLTDVERTERIDKLLKLFDLWTIKDRRASALSAGETTRTVLVKAFLPKPRVVLLDEPTASLDPDIAHEVRNFVLEQRKHEGTSVLFTSHNMDEVTQVCDRVLVLKQGKIIAHDTPNRLAATVSKARIEFVSTDNAKIRDYALQNQLVHSIREHAITVEIDEHQIAEFLTNLAHAHIGYQQISIDKPTLEDYFLHIAQRKKGL